MIIIRWRLVNHAGAVIDYIINSEKSLNQLLDHIIKYQWRGCIEYTTILPAYFLFEKDEIEKITVQCREYRDCHVGIKWVNKFYYEMSGYNRYSLEEDPEYFHDEDVNEHTGYILLLENYLVGETDYFYLNDDTSGAY